MAKMTTDELLGVFEEMTVLELKEFLDAFEEKFDVTAAAPVAVAAAPAGGGDDAGAAEKDSYDVVLSDAGSQKIQVIKEVRGVGLLIGLQLFKDQTEFIKKLMENKLLTIRAAENVIRILPPLNVKKQEIDLALKIISKVCNELK